MNGHDLVRTMVRMLFLITTGVVISMYFFCLLFAPDASFSLSDIGRILLMSVAGDLPFVVFYSKKELSKRKLLVRQAIHIPILLTVLLCFAFRWEWVSIHNAKQIAVFVVLVLVVYAAVDLAVSLKDKKLTEKLNSRLKERNQL